MLEDDSAYLLLEVPSQDKSLLILDALDDELPKQDFEKIRTMGLLNDMASTLTIQFTGKCESDRSFVDRVRQLAVKLGATDVTCSPLAPVEPHAAYPRTDAPLSNSQSGAYLLLQPSTEQLGFDAIDVLRKRLPASEQGRIRGSGLLSSRNTAMTVEFSGTCSTASSFVELATRIVRQNGVARVECRDTLPTIP